MCCLTLTKTELKGLWLAATTKYGKPRSHPSFKNSPVLYRGAVRALYKIARCRRTGRLETADERARRENDSR